MHTHRALFIASLGNPKPYHQTRHSAGHILLDAVRAPLAARIPPSPTRYQTWRSPSLMNVSGSKLVRQLSAWISELEGATQARGIGTGTGTETGTGAGNAIDQSYPFMFRPTPTLVLLHDELEAPLGAVKVRRGGPEKASLRGHRGLVSVFESLRGKRLFPPPLSSAGNGSPRLSVMRVGVGIGRPSSRNRGDVADYVLTEMDRGELVAVKDAAGPVVDLLVDEIYRVDEVD